MNECGGYCFLNQIERYWEGGKYLARKLEELGLVKMISYSNYKFVMLGDTAMKYLSYRDDPKDYSDTAKNMIPIKKLKSNPSEKVLFTSSFKFEIMHSLNKDFLEKTKYLDIWDNKLNSNFKSKENEITEIKQKILKLEQECNEYTEIYTDFLKELEVVNLEQLAQRKRDIQNEIDKQEIELQKLISLNRSAIENRKLALIKEQELVDKLLYIQMKIKKSKQPYFNKKEQIKELSNELNKMEEIQKKIIEKIEKARSTILNLHDKSKIMMLPIDKGNLIFLIFDTGATMKNPKTFWELINNTLEVLGYEPIYRTEPKEIEIIFFANEYESRLKEYTKIAEFVQKQLKRVNCDIGFSWRTSKITEALKDYKKQSSSTYNHIKEKDIDSFENLRDNILSKKKTKKQNIDKIENDQQKLPEQKNTLENQSKNN